MPSAQDLQADLRRMRRRFRLTIAAVTFGAFVLVAATMVAAFMVIDQRVAQAFKDEPAHDAAKRSPPGRAATPALAARVAPQTEGRASAPPRARPAAAPQQSIAGETEAAPDETLDQDNSGDEVHHGRRRHHRRHRR